MEYLDNIPYIRIKQPIGIFYVAQMKVCDILEIAQFDMRRIERDETNDIDSYFGIQRQPSPARLKEIAKYVTFSDATFPTNIVVAISSYDDIESKNPQKNIEEKDGYLRIRRDEEVAKIIDGQHRLLGLQKAIDKNNQTDRKKLENEFELSVTIYVDMDIADQSMVFSTINKAQTKVNKSLVYDLYDLANSRSPYKTAHNIVRVLNENSKSPLKNKVKMLGIADDTINETIAQATLVDSIVKYISIDPLKDRDVLKKKGNLDKGNPQKQFFRNWFINEQDILIARTILNYFLAISQKWPNAWKTNSILVKSTGIIGFMNFLQDIINNKYDEIDWTNEIPLQLFEDILHPIKIVDTDFTNENYPSGSTGQSKLRNELKQMTGLQ